MWTLSCTTAFSVLFSRVVCHRGVLASLLAQITQIDLIMQLEAIVFNQLVASDSRYHLLTYFASVFPG